MATANVNVHPVERLVSGFVGWALLARSLKRCSLDGLALGVAGGLLLYRGISGHSFSIKGWT